ncbi:MAG: endolytic transglycosylase MltG [Dehalococcoidia bacterium]|nr:endolytic transglycosylase MltG [Dehalococcoidia bacterium]
MRKRENLLVFLVFTLVFVTALFSAPLLASPERITRVLARANSIFTHDPERITQALARVNSMFTHDTESRLFVVNEGEDAAEIAKRLAKEGIVKWPVLFSLFVTYMGVDEQLRAGVYQLRGDMDLYEVLEVLRSGKGTKSITIPEGLRAAEIRDDLGSKGIVNSAEFTHQIVSARPNLSILASVPQGSSLEGYLFPDTYQLSPDLTASGLAELMVGDLDRRFTEEMRSRARDMGMTAHQIITLASIVEREAKYAEERDVIAGVFLNRLREGMPLAADPTVQYAIAPDSTVVSKNGYWKKELTAADLAIESPYNTYLRVGLPPGPICNPGMDSINAVLHPRSTNYLYFVATKDGRHHFTSTYREHLNIIAKLSGG